MAVIRLPVACSIFTFYMLSHIRRPGFIEPCLPSPADHPPSGSSWIHEIKHDGYRLMARRDLVGIRLITRRGNDWSDRFPLVIEAVPPQSAILADRRGGAVLR